MPLVCWRACAWRLWPLFGTLNHLCHQLIDPALNRFPMLPFPLSWILIGRIVGVQRLSRV